MWAQIFQENPDCEVVAYMDTNPEALAVASERFGARPEQLFTNLDEALSVPADFVCMVTPPMVHREQARKVFDRGLHLLAEKPLTLDMVEAVEIVRWAEQAGCMLTVGLNFRYLPVSQALRELVQSGAYGPLHYGMFHYARNRDGKRPGLNKYPLVMEQPMLLEQSIHHFDLIRYCYGREILSVQADTYNPADSMYAHDACVAALFQLEGGARVTYHGTWVSGWNEGGFAWRTDFAQGVALQQEIHGQFYRAAINDQVLAEVPLPEGRPFMDDTAGLLRDFVATLRGERALPCTGKDHLVTLGVTLACAESAATGERVELEAFLARYGVTKSWLAQ